MYKFFNTQLTSSFLLISYCMVVLMVVIVYLHIINLLLVSLIIVSLCIMLRSSATFILVMYILLHLLPNWSITAIFLYKVVDVSRIVSLLFENISTSSNLFQKLFFLWTFTNFNAFLDHIVSISIFHHCIESSI